MKLRPSTSVLWLALMFVAHTAFAQDDAFKAGMKAFGDKKWQESATQLRRAVAANSQEADRKVRVGGLVGIGADTFDYLPYYYLGQVLLNLEDCAGAVDAWSKSEQQGIVKTRASFMKTLQDGYTSCDARGVLPPSKFDPLMQRLAVQITEANSLAATISNLGKANLDLWRQEMREQQYERATNEIQVARGHINTAARTRAAREFGEAGAAADRAKTALMTLSAGFSASVQNLGNAQALTRDVDQILEGAEASDRAIDGKQTWLTQALSSARQYGRDAMVKARDRRAEGLKTTSTTALVDARSLAQDAATKFKVVLDELTKLERGVNERRMAEVSSAAQQAFAFVDGALGTLDRLTKEKPTLAWQELASERENIARQLTAMKRRYDAALKSQNVSAIVESTRLATEARDRLNVMIAGFGPVTIVDRGVHPVLERGARLFLAGEYQQALSALNPAEGIPQDIPLQAHAHLFRAATQFALYVRGREADEALRTQVLSEIEHSKRLAPGLQPDPRAFSPRFIRLFQSGSTSGSPSPR